MKAEKRACQYTGYCKNQSYSDFLNGYHQAEQDLALTWEDLKLLQDISQEVFAEVVNGSIDYYQIYPTHQSYLEEVLKRFKERKKFEYEKAITDQKR